MQHPFTECCNGHGYKTPNCNLHVTQEGEIGIIHKNENIEEQASQVNVVKRSGSGMISDSN